MKKQKKGSDSKRCVKPGVGLPAIRPNVAGIDIGSREMYICGPVREDGTREIAVFPTTTEGIQRAIEWLLVRKVESVAMESTGVYWIAPFEMMEATGKLEMLLVDTRPLSRVPGRKSDVEDCQWVQTLHSHGLLQSSYRPNDAIVQVRSLVRQKAVLVAEQADWVRRMHKCLDQMNVRVHHAVSDTQGSTGMAIIRAIVAGERDAHQLAELRDARCHKSKEQIAAYLLGNWRSDHMFNLQHTLQMYDLIGEQITAYEREIQWRMEQLTPAGRQHSEAPPLPNPEKRKAMKRRDQEKQRQGLYRMVGADLTTIDGIGVGTAETIISEYGIDLSKFATEKEFVKHVQLTPYKPVSGGKVLRKRRGRNKSTRTADALRTAAVAVRNSQRVKAR
jgi:transposase